MNKDAISQAIVRLFESEMFYAELITQMRRVLDPKLPAVAGVCIKNTIELHINPGVFEKLPIEQRVSILRHECEHILRDHIPRMKELAPEVFSKDKDIADQVISGMKFKSMNIGADLAINGNMKDLPEWGCFPKTFNLPEGETFEWYMDKLKNNDKMKQLTEFDDHSLWRESDEQSKEILKEKIRQAVNKAAKKAKAAGKLTSDQEMLVEGLNKSMVSWKELLRRFVARSLEYHIETSKKKRNRRYGIMFPGSVKIEDLHIGVITDSSGSVSDPAYEQFMAEIGNIAKYTKVTVVDADCRVTQSYVFKKGKKNKRKGYGGTAYQPGFDYFNKVKDIDAVIYFGDMDSSDKPTKPKYPVLWAIIGEQDPPGDFGGKIRIKVANE
jgi:predicted metal-dependent peptidase